MEGVLEMYVGEEFSEPTMYVGQEFGEPARLVNTEIPEKKKSWLGFFKYFSCVCCLVRNIKEARRRRRIEERIAMAEFRKTITVL